MFSKKINIKCVCLIFLILGGAFFVIYPANSQIISSDTLGRKIIPTTKDTSKKFIDTSKYYIITKNHGRVFQLPFSNYETISKEDIVFERYNEMSDILSNRTSAYPLSLGSPSQFNSLSFFGGTPQDLAISYNNRSLVDLEYGSYNFNNIPTEMMEKAEIITGSDAVILSGNSSGALLNIQDIRYNTKVPYTKLWYGQTGYDFLSADGVYTQNFAPNWNFNFGFRAQSGLGRFTNNKLDAWNLRLGIRWNIADRTAISLTEMFTNHGIGTNGGVVFLSDVNSQNTAPVYYSGLSERVFQHDITLSFSSTMGSDSSTAISSNIFYTTADNSKNITTDLIISEKDSSLRFEWLSRYFGADVRYEQRLLSFFTLRFGADYLQPKVEKTIYHSTLDKATLSAFAHGQLNLTDSIFVSGGMRLTKYENSTTLSVGAKSSITLFQRATLLADLSCFERTPSAVEMLSNVESEKGFLGILKFSWKGETTGFNLEGFFRNTDKPILLYPIYNLNATIINTIAYNGNNRKVLGLNADFSTKLFKHLSVSIYGRAWQSQTDGTKDYRFPQLYTGLNTYYEITAGRSLLRLGMDVKGIINLKGEQFLPISHQYMPYSGIEKSLINGIDLYAVARLGNAYVKITYQNVLSAFLNTEAYYTVPIYPIYDSNFNVSLSWSFMD